MTTGQRIKAARKKADITQEVLGKKLGVSSSFVAQYETGKRSPKLETLRRIADALGASIYDLIDGDDLKRAVIYGESLADSISFTDDMVGPTSQGSTAATQGVSLSQGESVSRSVTTSKSETRSLLRQLAGPDFGEDETISSMHLLDGRMGSGKSTMINALIKIPEGPLHRISTAWDKLNEEGQEKAAERVEELTEIPRYQAQEPPTAPAQDTPATDTTPEKRPSGGRTRSITTVCPICGMGLRGVPSAGEVFCPNCKDFYPLSQK